MTGSRLQERVRFQIQCGLPERRFQNQPAPAVAMSLSMHPSMTQLRLAADRRVAMAPEAILH